MAEFFTNNVPDDQENVMGPPGTTIADRLRRVALMAYGMGNQVWKDPGHTLLPWTRPLGAVAREMPAYISNQLRNLNPGDPGYTDPPPRSLETSFAGQYVGPQDMRKAFTIPGYVPRQEMENLVRQDPLAGLLGPMQPPAPKQPEPTAGF